MTSPETPATVPKARCPNPPGPPAPGAPLGRTPPLGRAPASGIASGTAPLGGVPPGPPPNPPPNPPAPNPPPPVQAPSTGSRSCTIVAVNGVLAAADGSVIDGAAVEGAVEGAAATRTGCTAGRNRRRGDATAGRHGRQIDGHAVGERRRIRVVNGGLAAGRLHLDGARGCGGDGSGGSRSRRPSGAALPALAARGRLRRRGRLAGAVGPATAVPLAEDVPHAATRPTPTPDRRSSRPWSRIGGRAADPADGCVGVRGGQVGHGCSFKSGRTVGGRSGVGGHSLRSASMGAIRAARVAG